MPNRCNSQGLKNFANQSNDDYQVAIAAKSRLSRFFAKTHDMLRGLYEALYGLVLHSFKNINRKIRSKFPVWRMKEKTSEHVPHSVEVFAWIILPLSLTYVGWHQFILSENVLGPML